jgi:hypothetical protein
MHSPVSKREQLIASLVRFRTCRLTQAFDDSVVAIESSMEYWKDGMRCSRQEVRREMSVPVSVTVAVVLVVDGSGLSAFPECR